MKIHVQLYASLSKYMPSQAGNKPVTLELAEGATIDDLMGGLKIPSDMVKLKFLNGRHATGDEVLKEGDRVGIFPPVAGG
jgi:molybdopterin converting factor small subunit